MDLSLTETQTMLQSVTKELMDQEVPKSRVLEIDDSESGFDALLWEKMCEMGLPGILISEEYGGSGNTLTDLGVVYEVLGYYACPSPHLSSAVLAAQVIALAGSEKQKQDLLPAIASGQQIFAFAFTEPDYGWGPESIQLMATREGDTFTLNGTKLFVPDANVADQIVVAVRTGQEENPGNGITLFVIPNTLSGINIRTQSGWIGPKVCEVNFENVTLNENNLIGNIGDAWPTIEQVLDKGTAVLAAFMAGGTQRVYDMARDYSQSRIAFGVPIGTFQRVQDHVIEALNAADAGKWSAFEALWKLDEGSPGASVAVSMAKSVASTGFPQACDLAHHVHGGIGTDLEYGLTQYTKRARTLQHYLGDAIYHKRRMAQLLIQ